MGSAQYTHRLASTEQLHLRVKGPAHMVYEWWSLTCATLIFPAIQGNWTGNLPVMSSLF